MRITREKARALLKEHDLRATGPRTAVLRVLAAADTSLSHGQVPERLGEVAWDPAMVYRSLEKLRHAVVSRAEGIDRCVRQRRPSASLLPMCRLRPSRLLARLLTAALAALAGCWSASILGAMAQLGGQCRDSLAAESG